MGRIAIRNAVFDEAIGADDTDWRASFAELLTLYRASLNEAAEAAKQEAGGASSFPLDAYTGVYDRGAYGRIAVKRKGESLVAIIGGVRRYALVHWGGDAFKVMLENPSFSWPAPSLLRFETAGGERPDALVFEAAGQSATYLRLEE